MKTKLHVFFASGLLVAAVGLTPSIVSADGTIPQAILELCNDLKDNPDADRNCKGQCVAALHVCLDEQTGDFTPTPSCERKILKVTEACFDVDVE